MEKNNVAYGQYFWISQIANDATFIKSFIIGNSMRISMFNSFNSLKLPSVNKICFNYSHAKKV